MKTFCALYHYIEASQTEICLSNGLTIRKQQPEKKRMDKSIVYANICVRYKYAIAYNHAAFWENCKMSEMTDNLQWSWIKKVTGQGEQIIL